MTLLGGFPTVVGLALVALVSTIGLVFRRLTFAFGRSLAVLPFSGSLTIGRRLHFFAGLGVDVGFSRGSTGISNGLTTIGGGLNRCLGRSRERHVGKIQWGTEPFLLDDVDDATADDVSKRIGDSGLQIHIGCRNADTIATRLRK